MGDTVPHPDSVARAAHSHWRIVPGKWTVRGVAKGRVRWIIYRHGVRMWTKTSLPSAIRYVLNQK